jgi:glycosyltransferase involved in cell wall biosynthesis
VKVCLLIPIFDHGEQIRGVLDSLARHDLPCLVVDDGSGPATRAVLDAAEKDLPWVDVHHRDRNGGRGAALETGYRWASRRGYSHAIQLDADGQHDADDVPSFLDAIAASPQALILGSPIFDASAPKSRLYGRQLSRAMVWLATLSFDVTDPLCGFRAIPLEPTLALIDSAPLGDHMEFDPNLVIRLHWRGLAIRNVPTKVVYNPGALSHFDTLRDNVRMSRVYATALGGMIMRSPILLRRRLNTMIQRARRPRDAD